MSEKKYDKHNRWRSKTVGFRMSPEENDELDKLVWLSGMTKQDYLIRRALQKAVIINGNPRVYKALSDSLTAVLEELRRIDRCSEISDETLDIISQIMTIIKGMRDA